MYLKLIIGFFLVLLQGALIGFLGFPAAFDGLLRGKINLKPGTPSRVVWEKLPFPMTYKVYVFNVTNADEIGQGAKPKVAEIGPFVFEEWKDKYNVEDIEDEDAVSFNMRNTFKFRPDLGLDGEQLITMPHPLLQFMAITTLRNFPENLPGMAMGLDLLFKPQNAFVTASFMDLFYRGIDVNCVDEHPAVQAICGNFQKGLVPGAIPLNATHYKFSLLGSNNHTNAGRFKVSRGKSKSFTLGQVLTFNGQDRLNVWPNSSTGSCNQLSGTDGTIFAPSKRLHKNLWSFSAALCCSVSFRLSGHTIYNHLPALRYDLDFREPNVCCRSSKDWISGTVDLEKCTGTPMLASLPHFLKSDLLPDRLVDGLMPNTGRHSSGMVFERISGTVLAVHNRLQFSLQVDPVPQVAVMSKLRTHVMPLFWIEESLELNESFAKSLYKKIFLPMSINNIYRWISIVIGGLGLAVGIFLMYRQQTAQRVGAT
ncbi:sensory neuron membrane protein 1-like [Drosophila tropicalis]|uniref:sensory neuron membrane protein 1-like n=1 Tax=Drosophila tropicalis TaxID=46794 RepID=UPI0035ABF9D7